MKIRERVGMVLFGLVFVAVGVGGTYSVISQSVALQRKAESFVAGQCTITGHEVTSFEDSDGDTMYRPRIRYVHTVGTTEHHGDRIGFSQSSSSMRSHAEGVLEHYPVGSRQPCWFDPQHPADVVLDRSTQDISLAALVTLAFGLMGLGVIVLALGRSRAAGSADAMGGARVVDAEGRAVLLSRQTHAFDLLVRGGFALAFGGAAVALVLEAWRAGAWGSWLFAASFVGVGLGLMAWFVVALLRAVGPRVRLSLAAPVVQVGGSVRLRWSLHGLAQAGLRGELSLVAQEEVTTGVGDDEETKTTELHRRVLTKLGGKKRAGEVSVVVPASMPPSWAEGRTRMVWLIEVKAAVPSERWPDLDEQYEITVEAPQGQNGKPPQGQNGKRPQGQERSA